MSTTLHLIRHTVIPVKVMSVYQASENKEEDEDKKHLKNQEDFSSNPSVNLFPHDAGPGWRI